MTGTWTFSPDSKVVAYVAGVSGASRDHVFVGESAVVMNSDVLQAWPHDGNKGLGVGAEVYFSPNSKRHAYTVAHESGGVIVVDGTRGPGYDEKVGAFREFPKCQDYLGYGKAGWKDHGVEFSPDSDHYAYAARNEKNATVFLDGEPHWTGERILSSGMLFSNDAQRLAFGAEAEDGSQFMVVDRVPQKRFYGLPPSRKSFSPDSRRIAYFASDGRSTLLVIDSEVRRVPGVIPAGSRILWDGPEQLHTLVARGRSISLTRFAVGSGD
jgi:hypothetical protein